MHDLPDLPALRYLKSLPQWVCHKGKIPMCPHNALRASVTNPATWGTYAQAIACCKKRGHDGVGFVLTEHDDLTGIDLDHCRDPKTGQFEPWAAEVLAFKETYAEISVSGTGVHILALGKIEKTVKADKSGVEMYRSARYLIVTGHHVRETPTDILAAPQTEMLLRARVEAARPTPKIAAPSSPQLATLKLDVRAQANLSGNGHDHGRDFFREVNTSALTRLDTWVPVLHPEAKFQPGTGAWRVSSADLGRPLQEDISYAPTGIRDFGREEGKTAIDMVIEYGAAPDARHAAFWLCERMGRRPEDHGWGGDAHTGVGAELARGLVAKVVQIAPEKKPDLHLLLPADVDWTRPAGVLGDMTEWILASSRRPNRPLAASAAVVILSAICGRHLYGPTGTALNLYVVALARTGVGKDRPLAAVEEILRAAGLAHLHTTAKGFSVSAVEKMIHDHPCCVATVDEIGGNFLGRMSHRHANSHETSMRTTLMELWSRDQGKGPFIGTRRATAEPITVPAPSLTIYGVSTPEAFYGAVTAGSAVDGFLNRFLLAPAAPRAKGREIDEARRRVPPAMVDALRALVPRIGANLGLLEVYALTHAPAGARLGWANAAVKADAEEFEDQILAMIDSDPETGPLLGRVFETTVRLAGLHAASRTGLEAYVGAEDLAWAKAWVLGSAQAMIDGVQNMMAASEYEEKFNLVRKVIREAGTIKRRELLRAVRSIGARERDDIVKHLIEGGWIETIQIASKTKTAGGFRWLNGEENATE
jgi:hypothetical protein